MADLAVDFLGRALPSPLVLASGIWGTTVSLLVRAAGRTSVLALPGGVRYDAAPHAARPAFYVLQFRVSRRWGSRVAGSGWG